MIMNESHLIKIKVRKNKKQLSKLMVRNYYSGVIIFLDTKNKTRFD